MLEVLSRKVVDRMGLCDGQREHLRQMFVSLRADAGGELHAVYTSIAKLFPLPCPVDEMVLLELQTEREMLVPINATLRLVEKMRAKGDGNVMYVSDMYLPSSFIRERLEAFGFFRDGDRLYVSDELGAWKRDGSLFRLIHEQENIPYRRWHHYGDSRQNDYDVPRRLGIHAHRLRFDYLPYEEQWRTAPTLHCQYPALLAGVARAVRLSSDAPDDQKAFVCDISAPLITMWVARIMADATRRGIRRLYFCARDVHTHFRVARTLLPLFPDVEVRYLFISSPALYESPLCLDYLRQEGMCGDDPVAIVDSCSGGKTLRVMNEKLVAAGCKEVYGYFWAKMDVDEPLSRYASDWMLCCRYIDAVVGKPLSRIGGIRILYELLFSVNHHYKVFGYERRRTGILRPVLKPDEWDKWGFTGQGVRSVKKSNDRLCESFAQACLSTGILPHCDTIMERLLLPTLVEYTDRPRRTYLDYPAHFLWWEKPFVGAIRGKDKGVWKRGNLFYSLPAFLTTPLRHVLGNYRMRRRFNSLASGLHRLLRHGT